MKNTYLIILLLILTFSCAMDEDVNPLLPEIGDEVVCFKNTTTTPVIFIGRKPSGQIYESNVHFCFYLAFKDVEKLTTLKYPNCR